MSPSVKVIFQLCLMLNAVALDMLAKEWTSKMLMIITYETWEMK
jgi:hypothetical protein